jgi:osmotically-inducible protein OsmY
LTPLNDGARRRLTIASHVPTLKGIVMTKSDSQLKKDVESELEWDAVVHANNIGVAVKAGVVTLSGHLDSFAEKYAAERAVQRVQGVKGLAVELDVRLGATVKRTDAELASAAAQGAAWSAPGITSVVNELRVV